MRYSGLNLFPPRELAEEGVFFQKLRNYDQAAENPSVTGQDAGQLIRLLDELEKIALGVESQLSVLKRRRALAVGYAGVAGSGAGRSWSGSDAALDAYRASAERVAASFPHSESLAAVAAEAATRSALRENSAVSPPLSGVIGDKVRQYATVMGADPRFAAVALSAYVLAGDMATPGRALSIPGGEELLLTAVERRGFQGWESLLLDAAILAVLKNDAPRALERLTPLLEQAEKSGIAEAVPRFEAELLYDAGEFERAADLFARLGDDWSMSRRADALVLAGRKDVARSLWTVLAAPEVSGGSSSSSRDIRIRSLYNLAATAPDAKEETATLERLIALDREHLFGIIRYTRLLPALRAITILEDSTLADREALADLELLRRHQENWPMDRTVPETWLLINRHAESEALYQWASYYFAFQRRYYEIPPLLRATERKGFTGSWLKLQEALEHLRQGRFNEAEKILTDEGAGGDSTVSDSWEVHANLGRLLEAKRSYMMALKSYETAASIVQENKDAAKIQWRISRCLRALGQDRESLKVLEYAQTLDKENLTIRLERERVEQSLY
jgi:tetratricopeptide (TPR) repeat protein